MHAKIEEQRGVRGRELLRRLHQDHPDLRTAREQCLEEVAGAEGMARSRAEAGHTRPLATVFGQVTVTRIAYRAPGAPSVHPADAALNTPGGKLSHGLRRHAVARSARGSFEDTAAAITRATGVTVGKRQAEELARRAAADVDAFYGARRPGPAPDDQLLVLTCDGKGIVMRPEALRPATTGARWGLDGTEAVLKLRALISNGDFDQYWACHLRQEHMRVHQARYRDDTTLAA
jgi:hypothetical protein